MKGVKYKVRDIENIKLGALIQGCRWLDMDLKKNHIKSYSKL